MQSGGPVRLDCLSRTAGAGPKLHRKFKGKKWPWILFVVVGFGQLGINWTTGDLTFTALSVQLPPATWTKG